MKWIAPNWPAPSNIKAAVTTREGGLSQGVYAGFNLGFHVGDDPQVINAHRQQLREQLQLTQEPQWLQQVHGVAVVEAGVAALPIADACFTQQQNQACAVLTADCLPVLFCNKQGTWVAAAHGGWRGLVAGILYKTVARYEGKPCDVMAWLGPAISQAYFEVGDDVRDAVMALNPDWQCIFKAGQSGKWFADLYQLARLQLGELGVTAIYGGDYCTYADAQHFYSYRRDGVTGRMASLIWIN